MDAQLTEDLPFKILRREWQPVAISKALKQGDIKSFVLLNTQLLLPVLLLVF